MTRSAARELATALVRSIPDPLEAADVALYPPFTCLSDVLGAVSDSEISVGAQNMHPQDQGAFTGEISPSMLLDVGATRVLCGHSERRQLFGESDDFVNQKVLAALGHDILPTLCVGETLAEREAGQTAAVVERQVRAGLAGVGADKTGEVTVAYEPVWAIGTGLTATPAQAGAVHAQIRALLQDLWAAAGETVRILYGGSVKPANARELLGVPHVNGALVGGASLSAPSFAGIIAATS